MASAAGGGADAVLDIVMLVDESGSESPANVADERQTAGTITQSLLNPHSRVTVVGFGGVNHVTQDQNPTDVVCQPTVASGAVSLAYLSTCVKGLHARTDAEGNDTDYAAALGQAMSYFSPGTAAGRQSPPGAVKAILMMTDGGVDVHRDTQQYGGNWLAGEQHAVGLQLAAARAAGVQVWPLGFGTILPKDQAYLDYLAANGAQTACDSRQASKPHATIVKDSADALAALDALYAAAGCIGTSGSGTEPISGGQTLSLQVTIPSIATDAAISVDRRNPAIQVSFYRPDGTLWTDASALSGTGTAVAVLHVTEPPPGVWRIKLTAPPGMASELVSATAFWQGAVDALMTATPTSAPPGQPIAVTLSVLSGNGRPITDAATIARLQVGVTVTGPGLAGPVTVPVSNAGESSGSATGVADYKGTFTAPRTTGALTFTGTAAGYGLYATEVPATVQVGGGAPPFQCTVQMPVASSVQTGQSIQGKVICANKSGTARSVLLSLSVSPALATMTSPAGVLRIPPGNPPPTPFTITFASNSPLGPAAVDVKVEDAANPRVAYSVGTLQLTVDKPPSIWDKYRWEIVAVVVAALLGLLFALRRRRQRRDAIDVRGLVAMLRRDGQQVGAELKAPGRRADTFRFVIRDEDDQAARLDTPRPGDSAYAVRRDGTGRVRVAPPDGEDFPVTVGGSGEALPSGLLLAFGDKRRPGAGSPRSARPARHSGPGSGHGRSEVAVKDASASGTPPADAPDPWLS